MRRGYAHQRLPSHHPDAGRDVRSRPTKSQIQSLDHMELHVLSLWVTDAPDRHPMRTGDGCIGISGEATEAARAVGDEQTGPHAARRAR